MTGPVLLTNTQQSIVVGALMLLVREMDRGCLDDDISPILDDEGRRSAPSTGDVMALVHAIDGKELQIADSVDGVLP